MNDDDVSFSHGTRCGGAAVGKANNEVCGVGVAFNANVSGERKNVLSFLEENV